MTSEKYAVLHGIRNQIIVLEQEHQAERNRLVAEITRLGCDHKNPTGEYVTRGDWRRNVFCRLCDKQVA